MHLSWLICITKSKLVSEESAPLTRVSHWSFSAVAVLKSKMTSRSGLGGVSCPLCAPNRRDRIWRLTRQVQPRRQISACCHTKWSLTGAEQMTFRGKGSREERGLQGQIWKMCYNNGAKLSYHHRRSKVVISYVECAEQLCPVWRLFSPLWGHARWSDFSGILSEHPTDYNIT